MRVLVVYESMYGNTHTVAERIGEGLAEADRVDVVPVGEATSERVAAADLLVVGGPTHIHGMSTEWSRRQALDDKGLEKAAEEGHELEVDPDAEGPGLRDWFSALAVDHPLLAAAFDTRFDAPAIVTGRASRGIRRRLVHHGFTMVADPESFEVDEDSELLDGEEERAVAWGRSLLVSVAELAARERPRETPADDHLDTIIESGGRIDPQ